MSITASMVKELREKTGVGMMDCKQALVECNGDMDAAVQYLREKGLAKASKKADRAAKEGRIFTAVSGSKAAILELNCETDFVASNEDFAALGNDLVSLASENGLSDADALASAELNGLSVTETLSNAVLKLGENIQLGQLQYVESASIADYVHQNGKIGVLVNFDGAVPEAIGKDVAMQVAAVSPQFVRPEEVPSELIDKEKEVLRTQALNEGKPEQVVDKIVEGKVAKYYKEICLLEQSFVKDGDKTVSQVLPDGVTVSSFIRYSLV